MSREIKFRVRIKDTNTIHIVTELRYAGGSINEVGIFDPEHLKLYGSTVRYYGILDVDLMQYTGLKDKNGVDIYEGDIVDDNGFIGRVNYSSIELTYKLISHEMVNRNLAWITPNNCDIIGNIYEHPNLTNK